MSPFSQNLRFRALFMALTVLVVLFGATLPSRAHIVSVADQLRGITMTQAQCAALPQAVWVSVIGRPFCIRYYLSVAGGAGTRPAVFLQGDRLGRLNLKTGEFSPGPRDRDLDTDDFERMAEVLSRQTATAAIYLARPGLDGSSGDHRIRHTTLELTVINAALDAIKRRHGFEGFHMIGQSGGSTLVGGMLALRSDVGCAVIGSGRLLYDRTRRSPDPAADYFNVADAVPVIAQKRATRILVLTDPQDRKVPEPVQTGFVRMLRQAGGQAEQFLVQAIDDDRHGVTAYSRTAAAACMRGASGEDIAQRLEQQVEKRLAAKAAVTDQQTAARTTASTTGSSANATASAMTAQSAGR
jgi:pimeloyl-ACP methyl ester carboxylesterase